MADRPYPDLLTPEENRALRTRAERVWAELQKNQLGGYSGGNRPFWIHAEFKAVIEEFGRRDIGQTWTKDQLDAAKPDVT
jgi:hypothetical protein